MFQAIAGVVLLPFTTTLLGPTDYGVYGFAILIAAFSVSLCETGLPLVLYDTFPTLSGNEIPSLISSLLLVAVVTSAAMSLIVFVLFPILSDLNSLLTALTRTEILIVVLIIPLNVICNYLKVIFVVTTRSQWVAITNMIQVSTVFSSTMIALFLLDQGRTSLFWGYVLGFAACLTVSLLALGKDLIATPKFKWFAAVRSVAKRAWLSSITESLFNVVEGDTVSKATGAAGLGNYNHAKLYQSMALQGTNAFAMVTWPQALKDANKPKSDFIFIRLVWDFIYVGLSILGLFFVYFGATVVDILTNGKFHQAAGWIPFLIIYVLIQNTGKPATAIVLGNGKGNSFSRAKSVTYISSILLLFLFVPTYGVPAVISIAIFQILAQRLYIQWISVNTKPTPFQDHFAIAGVVVILAAVLWERQFSNEFIGHAVQLSVISLLFFITYLKMASAYLAEARTTFKDTLNGALG